MAARAIIWCEDRVAVAKRSTLMPDGFREMLEITLKVGDCAMNRAQFLAAAVRFENGEALVKQAARFAVTLQAK